MTEKQQAQLFLAAVVLNQGAWLFLLYQFKKDNNFMAKQMAGMFDAIEVLMETADTSDERFQQWATDLEFDIMSQTHLKSLKRKGWWRK